LSQRIIFAQLYYLSELVCIFMYCKTSIWLFKLFTMKKNLLLVIALVLFAMNSYAKEGLYIEFKMTSKSVNGTSRTYSSDGDSRTESKMTASYNGSDKPMVMTVLKLHNDPNAVYSLNETDKTYTVIDVSKVPNKDEQAEYEITVLGKERVNNYNCTHVKAVNKNTRHEMELWLSKDITQYERYASIKNKYIASNLYKQLREKGAEGFVVRLVMSEERMGQMEMNLVKAEERNIDASMFNLDGYTKNGNGTAPGRLPGNMDAQQLQNMTPEERQKYIDQMKQQYQGQGH
jgi:hypothetical protein